VSRRWQPSEARRQCRMRSKGAQRGVRMRFRHRSQKPEDRTRASMLAGETADEWLAIKPRGPRSRWESAGPREAARAAKRPRQLQHDSVAFNEEQRGATAAVHRSDRAAQHGARVLRPTRKVGKPMEVRNSPTDHRNAGCRMRGVARPVHCMGEVSHVAHRATQDRSGFRLWRLRTGGHSPASIPVPDALGSTPALDETERRKRILVRGQPPRGSARHGSVRAASGGVR